MSVIKSRFLGDVQVEENMLFNFAGSILGFEEYDYFYLIEHDENNIFSVLQSKTDENLAFILIDPFMFFANYEPDISEDYVAILEVERKEDINLYAIVTVADGDFRNMTANLIGPIVMNLKNHKGIQCILKTDKYTTKHRVIPEEKEAVNGN